MDYELVYSDRSVLKMINGSTLREEKKKKREEGSGKVWWKPEWGLPGTLGKRK